MIIIETCPKCGHDLTDLVIATYPPIPRKKCFGCGWSWEGKREEVIRVPFGGNATNTTNTMEIPSLNDCLNSSNEFYPSSAISSSNLWNGSSTLDNKYYNSYSYGFNYSKQKAYNR